MSITSALALTALNERTIVKAFRGAHATTGGTARRLRDLGLNHSLALRQMVTAAVLRKAGPERFYLDEEVWASRSHLQGRTVVRLAVVFIVVLAAAALYVAGT